MESRAYLKRLRIAPRKVRLLASLIKGMDYIDAKYQLTHWTKGSSKPLMKLIDSAAANAFSKNTSVKENLYIKNIVVHEGPTMKRYRPKGFGSTYPIAKRTSHIFIVLDEKSPGLKADDKKKHKDLGNKEIRETAKDVSKTGIDTASSEEIVKDDLPSKTPKPAIEKEIGKIEGAGAKGAKGFKRFFRRKSI